MGNDNGDRCKSSKIESGEASGLVVCILREVDTANAYMVELRDAVSREDRQRIAVIKADLHAAWTNAQGAISKLEQLSKQCETVARAALLQSQESARHIFDELWRLVRDGSGKAGTTVIK